MATHKSFVWRVQSVGVFALRQRIRLRLRRQINPGQRGNWTFCCLLAPRLLLLRVKRLAATGDSIFQAILCCGGFFIAVSRCPNTHADAYRGRDQAGDQPRQRYSLLLRIDPTFRD
ncbi:MAG: hypothetical protein ACI9G1_003004 [Pirellulaceae bacterium]|jgi:hypothetical protein